MNNLELSIFYVALINCPRHPDEAFSNGLFLKAAQLLLALVNYVEYTKGVVDWITAGFNLPRTFLSLSKQTLDFLRHHLFYPRQSGQHSKSHLHPKFTARTAKD